MAFQKFQYSPDDFRVNTHVGEVPDLFGAMVRGAQEQRDREKHMSDMLLRRQNADEFRRQNDLQEKRLAQSERVSQASELQRARVYAAQTGDFGPLRQLASVYGATDYREGDEYADGQAPPQGGSPLPDSMEFSPSIDMDDLADVSQPMPRSAQISAQIRDAGKPTQAAPGLDKVDSATQIAGDQLARMGGVADRFGDMSEETLPAPASQLDTQAQSPRQPQLPRGQYLGKRVQFTTRDGVSFDYSPRELYDFQQAQRGQQEALLRQQREQEAARLASFDSSKLHPLAKDVWPMMVEGVRTGTMPAPKSMDEAVDMAIKLRDQDIRERVGMANANRPRASQSMSPYQKFQAEKGESAEVRNIVSGYLSKQDYTNQLKALRGYETMLGDMRSGNTAQMMGGLGAWVKEKSGGSAVITENEIKRYLTAAIPWDERVAKQFDYWLKGGQIDQEYVKPFAEALEKAVISRQRAVVDGIAKGAQSVVAASGFDSPQNREFARRYAAATLLPESDLDAMLAAPSGNRIMTAKGSEKRSDARKAATLKGGGKMKDPTDFLLEQLK